MTTLRDNPDKSISWAEARDYVDTCSPLELVDWAAGRGPRVVVAVRVLTSLSTGAGAGEGPELRERDAAESTRTDL